MADINGSKTYQVTYNVVADAGKAANQFTELANVVQRITKSGTGMAKFNQQVRDIVRNTERLSTALGSFSPRLDMKTFNSQLRVMENAVAASAKTMQGMINAALTGNTKALQRATAKRGSWSQAIRDGLVADKKVLEKDLSNYKKELDRLMTMRRSGTTDGRLMTAQEIQRNNARIKSVQRQISSLENSLSSMTGSLAVLRKEASGGNTLRGLTVPANMAKGAEDLTKMSNAVKSWNKAVGNLTKKSVTFKINATDNASGTINAIKTKIEELQAMAANIFIGGGQKTPAKTQQKAQRVRRPAGVMSEKDIKDLGTLKDNVTRLATTRANGLWGKSYQEQYNQFASVASKVTGLPENAEMGDMIKALRIKHREELQKYNNWKNSLAKSAKPASKTPITPSTTPQTPTAITQLNNMAGTLRSLQGLADKNGVRISTRLNRNGVLAKGITGYETMQKLANTHPIIMRGLFDGGPSMTGLSQVLADLQALANTRPIVIRGIFNGSGAGFGLNQSIGNLSKLSEQNPVAVNSMLKKAKSAYAKPTLTKSAIPGNIATISKLGEEFNKQIKPLNLQLNTEAAKAKFREFIKYIQSNNKVKVTLNATTGGGRGRAATGGGGVPPIIPVGGTSSTAPIGTTKNPVIVASKGDANPMKRWSYPLTGNTSFGARTPAAVEMMKGMGVMMAIGGAMQGVGTAFSQATEYQNTMTTARAILKNNYNGSSFDSDFATMERVLRREGIQTKFTAAEEAGAAKFLAMAGLDMSTIKNAIKPVTNVALAGDLDLATTADKMTNIMTAFKLKSPSDFSHTADVLANTFTRSNTSMMQLAESAQYAAPIASARGMSLEEMMALIGVMGDAGIQGSMAGTSLRMMMNNIYNPSKTQAKMWEHLAKLGVTKRGSNGEWLNVTDILNQIAQKVPEKELADVMGKLFRVTSVAGATQLAKNIGKVKSLYSSNVTSNGVAESIRAERITNIQGRWAQVVSTFQEDILKLFEAPAFQEKLIALLEKFRSILAKPETLKSLEAVMDLLLFFGETMGQMAKIFLNVYNTAPGLIKFMMKFQIFMTAIGSYLLTPIIQFANLFNMLRAPLGILGGGALAAGAASGGAVAQNAVKDQVVKSGLISRGAVGYASGSYLASRSASRMAGVAALEGSLRSTYARRAKLASLQTKFDDKWMMTTQQNPQFLMFSGRAGSGIKAADVRIAGLKGEIAQQKALAQPFTKEQILGRYQKIYGKTYSNSWSANAARAASRSFNAGMTAFSFGSILSSAKSGLISVISGLSKVLGMLVSPVGLATLAIGGFAAAAVYASKRIERQKQVGIDSANRLTEGRKELDKITPTYTGLNLKGGVVYANKKLRRTSARYNGYLNPQLANYAGMGSVYDEIPSAGTGEWGDRIFNEYISKYSKYVFDKELNDGSLLGRDGKISLRDFHALTYSGSVAGALDQEAVRKYAQKALIYEVVSRNPIFLKAKEEIQKLSSDWVRLTDDERELKKGDFIKSITAIQNRFSDRSGKDISNQNLEHMRIFDIFNSLQGQTAAWDLLQEYLHQDNSPFKLAISAHSIKNDSEFSNVWVDKISNILSSINFGISDGAKMTETFLRFNGMTPDFAELNERLTKLGINFGNSVQEHLDVITQIVGGMMNIPGLKEIIDNFGGVQQLINYLLQQTASYKAWAAQNGIKDVIFNSVERGVAVGTGRVKIPLNDERGDGSTYWERYSKEIDKIPRERMQNRGFEMIRRPSESVYDDMTRPLNQNDFRNPYTKGYKDEQPKIFRQNGPLASITINESANGEATKEMVLDCLTQAFNAVSEGYSA